MENLAKYALQHQDLTPSYKVGGVATYNHRWKRSRTLQSSGSSLATYIITGSRRERCLLAQGPDNEAEGVGVEGLESGR
jgi:hypothetical protein